MCTETLCPAVSHLFLCLPNLSPPRGDVPFKASPGLHGLELLLFLGQLEFQLLDLGLQLGDLVLKVRGLAIQLPLGLLQLLPGLLLLL